MRVDLFPVSVYHYHVDHSHTFGMVSIDSIKETILNFYRRNKGSFNSPEGWNCDLFTTYGTDEFPPKHGMWPYIDSVMDEFHEDINATGPFSFTQAWLNCYESNHWQERHAHLPGQWSGVYYAILEPGEHQGTSFHDPNEDLRSCTGEVQNTVTAQVQEGDVLIFPSWLYHSALINKSKKLRATISFNFFIEDTKKRY